MVLAVAADAASGVDWDRAWQLVATLITALGVYLAATWKARHDAKVLQGSELSKQTGRLVEGWEAMTDQAQKVIAQQQAEMLASAARTSELRQELEEVRRHYRAAMEELEELRSAARRKRNPTKAD